MFIGEGLTDSLILVILCERSLPKLHSLGMESNLVHIEAILIVS